MTTNATITMWKDPQKPVEVDLEGKVFFAKIASPVGGTLNVFLEGEPELFVRIDGIEVPIRTVARQNVPALGGMHTVIGVPNITATFQTGD